MVTGSEVTPGDTAVTGPELVADVKFTVATDALVATGSEVVDCV